MIKWIKNIPNFKYFCPLDHNLCGSHTFENKKLIILERKKIVLSEISTIELIQIDFNRRKRKINLRFKMSYVL